MLLSLLARGSARGARIDTEYRRPYRPGLVDVAGEVMMEMLLERCCDEGFGTRCPGHELSAHPCISPAPLIRE